MISFTKSKYDCKFTSLLRGVVMHNRNQLFIGIWILLVCVGITPVQAAPRLDASFGLDGRVAVELGLANSAHAVVVQPDGKIVVAGSSSKGATLNFSLLRFNKDGSLDPTFNGDGSVITSVSKGDNEALALGLLSDGRIIAAGYSHNGRDRDFALVCYLPDGSRDLAFGSNGAVVTPVGNSNEEITAMTINAADMITVAGATEGTTGRVLVTARYFADGALDNSYGERGVSIVGVGEGSSAEGIVERKDGSLVISGSYVEKGVSSLMLVGLDADGYLNSRFGNKGVTVASGSFSASEGYGLAEDGEGNLYLAGSVGLAGKRDTAMFRFTKAGKADTSFGDKGVIITRVSEEDDLLYAVAVGKNGAVANGYTTDAGTRQFLLVTYSIDSTTSVTVNTKTSSIPTVEKGATKTLPVQEIRVNGGTKVQIRRLQVSSSLSDYLTTWYFPALLPSGNMTVIVPVQAGARLQQVGDGPSLVRWIYSAIERVGDFLLPSAVASERRTSTVTDAAISAHVVTTTFSEGESISYAATFDASGNLIVVGTANGTEASSIVVAQYSDKPETTTDSILDQPGYRSSYIATTPSADVTRTTAVIVGEIAPSFGMAVTKRGMVYSVNKDPVYLGRSESGDEAASSTTLLPRKMFDGLTNLLISPAVAAVTGNTSTTQFIENGETVNGAGYGTFSARLEKLKPGTAYFARAYALTSEGAVYYGNQLHFRTADACFVATASFGTLLHPGVGVLRDFRDAFLVKTTGGQRLVELYYTYSPPVADVIARNGLLRFAIRMLLLPFVGFSWLALQGGLALALLTFAGSAIIFGWLSSRACLRR